MVIVYTTSDKDGLTLLKSNSSTNLEISIVAKMEAAIGVIMVVSSNWVECKTKIR